MMCYHYQDAGLAGEASGAWGESRAGASLPGERLYCQNQSGRHSPPALRTVSSEVDPLWLYCVSLMFSIVSVLSGYLSAMLIVIYSTAFKARTG